MSSVRHNPILIFAISVSIFGLFIVLTFAFNPLMAHENFLWRKPFVGSVFSIICILGSFSALFPKQCSKAFHFRREKTNFASHKASATSKGHHPDCQEFSAHVIHLSGYTLCAACTGLLLGALIALIGTFFYFFRGWHLGEMGFLVVLIGSVELALGFFQLKFRGFVRLMLNALFVVGAFLILVGIDELTRSLSADLFITLLIVFWLFTRIQLSKWDHQRICGNCKSPCDVREHRKREVKICGAVHRERL